MGVSESGLAGGAEVEQHRRAVGAQVDVGRLDVEVQQLVGVDSRRPLSMRVNTPRMKRSRTLPLFFWT
jgi:hypothetical protein